jgi:hypothetical protein
VALVSAYNREYVLDVALYPRETRRLAADLRAVIAPGETITQAVWQMEVPGYVSMSAGLLGGTLTSVLMTAAVCGMTVIRCQVTTSAGNVYPQLFRVTVKDGPWLGDPQTAGGPTVITLTA